MRVAFFHAYPHQYAGAQRVTHALAEELAQRGHEVAVFLPDEGPFADRLRASGVAVLVVRAPAPWRRYGRVLEGPSAVPALALLPAYWVALARALRSWRPTIVHSNDHRGVLLAGVPAKLARAKLVWHLHGNYGSRPITALGARLADRILVVSQATLARQRGLEGAGSKTMVFHNGLLTAAPEARAEADLERPLVLTGARVHPDKGLDVLIDAAARVHARIPRATFAIAGNVQRGYEAHHEQLLARRTALGLDGVVDFVGFVDDPTALWRRAAVYVQPSRAEPFGMGVLEAMALGVPVVASRVDGLAEVVDGASALQVAPEDPDALADAIVRVIEDRVLAARMTSAAAERVATRFSRRGMVDRLVQTYEEVVA